VVGDADGDWWIVDGVRTNSFQGGAQTGKRFDRPEELRPAGHFADVRPGAYDPEAFLADNDLDGVWGSVLYPTEGLALYQVPDGASGLIATSDRYVRVSLAHMILSGVFERHPRLRVGSVEHELGWVPFFLDRLDYTYTQRARRPWWHRFKTVCPATSSTATSS
jgi:hypothetical protein